MKEEEPTLEHNNLLLNVVFLCLPFLTFLIGLPGSGAFLDLAVMLLLIEGVSAFVAWRQGSSRKIRTVARSTLIGCLLVFSALIVSFFIMANSVP